MQKRKSGSKDTVDLRSGEGGGLRAGVHPSDDPPHLESSVLFLSFLFLVREKREE